MAVSEPEQSPWTRGEVPCTYHRRHDRAAVLPVRQADLRAVRRANAGRAAVPRLRGCARPAHVSHDERLAGEGRRRRGGRCAGRVAVVWRFAPEWQFYLCLALGFGVAEAMAWAANYKRGRDLQLLGMALVVAGLVLARVLLARHYEITMEDVNAYGDIVAELLQLRLIPDLIFAGIAVVLPWLRFR